MSHSKSNRTFLVVWDMYGLENVVDLTKMDKHYIWNALKDGKDTDYHEGMKAIRYSVMRARLNTQRCYEVYTICTDGDVTVEMIKEMFEADPQTSAELIRSKGSLLHSDRSKRKQVIS